MSTEKTIRDYFAAIHRGGWQDFLAEDMTYGFNSALQDLGKEDYLNGAGNFLAMTIDVDVKHLVIDGDQAAVISDYFVKTPAGATAIFEVPEFLTIHNGNLTGISIFFDSAAFTALMKGEKV